MCFDLPLVIRRRSAPIQRQPRLDKCREEAGHVLGHSPELIAEPTCRGIKEVEAESIAFIAPAMSLNQVDTSWTLILLACQLPALTYGYVVGLAGLEPPTA